MMPIRSKIRSINESKKRKTWHIKSESKTSIVLNYCDIFFVLSANTFVNYLVFLGKPIFEPKLLKYISGTLTEHFFSGTPQDHSLLASYPAEPHPVDQS